MPSITTRELLATDIPLGMRLKTEAGWNQTLGDWQRVLKLDPHGSFVGQLDGVDVGTVATVHFGPIGWIGLMLVDASTRGKGVGKQLMQVAIDYLESCGVTSIRLDATPLGQPLYERLGFVAEYPLARFAGRPSANSVQSSFVPEVVTTAALDDIAALDQVVSRTDRRALLEMLMAGSPPVSGICRSGGHLSGYLLSRPGANATQIGPCLAVDSATGAALLEYALDRMVGEPVYVDIPDVNEMARAMVERRGLIIQRPLLRMTRGKVVGEQAQMIWSTFGPEKG